MTVPPAVPSGIPSTMRAAVLHGVGDVRVEELPVPQVGEHQVLVQVAAVGVCGSDVHYHREGRIADFVVEEPMILGHEASGQIVAVGAEVPQARIGQRVSLEPQHPCRRCEFCRTGRYNLCPHMEFYATPPIHGAFSEYAVIDADLAHPVPDSMTWEAAALCEPLSVGVWACSKARIGVGSTVLVTGAGPIGLIIAQTARALGASRVVLSDPAPERRAAAEEAGFTEVLDPAAGSSGGASAGLPADPSADQSAEEFDAFLDASGAEPAVQAGIRAVRPGGRVVLVGMGADDMTLPVSRILTREIELTGVFRYANTWPTAIQLAASGKVDLDDLVTARFGLDGVEEALNEATRPEHRKVLVLPSSLLTAP